MEAHKLFGELRSTLHTHGSARNFTRVLELFEQGARYHPNECERVWLPYTEHALQTWPDETRAVGGHVLRELARDNPPHASLVRTMICPHASQSESLYEDFARAHHLHHCTHVHISMAEFEDNDLEHVLSHTSMLTLQRLNLFYNCLTMRACELIAHAPQLLGLEHLILSQNDLDTRGLDVLCSTHGFEHLKLLWATQCDLLSVEPVAHAPVMRELESLSLSVNRPEYITDNDLVQLLGLPNAVCLRELRIGRLAPGDVITHVLRRQTHMTACRTLDLSDSTISARGIRDLAQAPCAAALNMLGLAGLFDEIHEHTWCDFFKDTTLHTVKELALGYQRISAAVVEALALACPNLGELMLSDAHLDAEAIRALVTLTQLHTLWIDCNQELDLAAVMQIAEMPWFPGLRMLKVYACDIDEDIEAALRAHPRCSEMLRIEQ